MKIKVLSMFDYRVSCDIDWARPVPIFTELGEEKVDCEYDVTRECVDERTYWINTENNTIEYFERWGWSFDEDTYIVEWFERQLESEITTEFEEWCKSNCEVERGIPDDNVFRETDNLVRLADILLKR